MLGMKTRAYRVGITILNGVGAIVILLQNGGDLTDPNTWLLLMGPIISQIIITWRQIGDSSTPTLPSGGPAKLP